MVGRNPERGRYWLATSSYVMLATAAAVAVFCVVWWSMQPNEDDVAWILSGLCASATIAAAVGLREIVLRKLSTRYQLERERRERITRNAALTSGKLTLEKHAAMLKNIEHKSHTVGGSISLPQAHWDMFCVCTNYLDRTGREMKSVSAGSPRLAAFRHGQEVIRGLHKHHLLLWAAGESGNLTQEARIRATISEKIETAQRALSVIESALYYYPEEPKLLDSVRAIKNFIVSVRISHLTEEAEKEAFKGRYVKAVDYYYDALYYLSKEKQNLDEQERKFIEKEINVKVAHLQRVLNG
jgi:hypothetical protein